MRTLLLLLLCLGWLGCQDRPAATTDDTAAETTAPAATAAAATQYPSLPVAKVEYLWENCDYVDFIFYDLNFSMSQNEQTGIRNTLAGISDEAPLINAACKPIGRLFFQVDGRNDLEADLFLDDNCIYYVFLENNQYKYANKLTDQGLGFYRNIFSKFLKEGEGTGNQN